MCSGNLLEAGNNTNMGDCTDNVQRVFHRHIVTYIQWTGGEELISAYSQITG